MKPFVAVVAAAMLCAAGGCITKKCPQVQLTLPELVTGYNVNAAPVKRLWAHAQIDMVATDDHGLPWKLATSGILLLRKDDDPSHVPGFVLIGREMGRDVFRLGHSPSEDVYYWWYNVGRQGEAFWGRRKYAGAPGIREVAMDPYQLLAVLGLWELPVGGKSLPAVALSMNTRPCQYVLTVVDREPLTGRVLFRREMLFDWTALDVTPRCRAINFFDRNGRRVMTAELDKYESVNIVGRKDARALMPTDITLKAVSWPGSRSSVRSIHLKFSAMTTRDKWDPDTLKFEGEDLPPGLVKTQLDRHIADKDPQR